MVRTPLQHRAVRIVQIAKSYRAGRTGLGASRDNLAVNQLAILGAGVDFGRRDALDTESAFFHHTHAAHSDVRVELQIKRFRPFRRVPVKSSHLVGTVVLAEAGPD